jgi:hypothetical protein
MTKQVLKTVIVLTALAASALAQAQTAPPSAVGGASATPPPSAFEKFAKEAKNPTDWLSWGGDLRVRNEYYDTIVTLNQNDPLSEQDVIRYRGRVWAAITPVTGLSLNARLSAEPREWMRPSFVGAYKAQSGMEWRYGIADNLNLKWTNAFNQPLTITAGRQDILIGDYYDWWLVADGTPGDGSWAFFLDSLRMTYEVKDIKTKFDVMYIYQNARPDEWIPTLGRSGPTGSFPGYNLTEQNEQGVIFYASNKSLKNTQLDGYFIYKRDTKEFSNGDNADIYTLGGKITGTPAEHWQYSVEGAYQFGSKQDVMVRTNYVNSSSDWRDISAYGGKAKLSYLCKDQWNNQISLVGEFLSGDDPNTPGKDEMFDLLWGRWPRWSELYIYSYINETGGKIAQINNLGRVGPSWSLNPIKNMTFSAMYNAMFAPEGVPTRTVAPTRFSGAGNFRGHYVQAILKHQFNKHISGHLWGEFIWEGDYYAQRDLMTFVRAEVMFTF